MGLCASCTTRAAVADLPRPSTFASKVILPEGDLEEYFGPVRAADVLLKIPPSGGSFLCCADDMDLDEPLLPIADEERLETGQIYFILPRSMLRRRLRLEDMAALASKASATLAKSGAIFLIADREGKPSPVSKKPTGSRAGGRARNFVPNLSAIVE